MRYSYTIHFCVTMDASRLITDTVVRVIDTDTEQAIRRARALLPRAQQKRQDTVWVGEITELNETPKP